MSTVNMKIYMCSCLCGASETRSNASCIMSFYI